LWGAGRVEDTYNLLGHTLRTALRVIARQQGRGLADVAAEARAAVVGGPRSLKAALDLNWDDPAARRQGLATVLAALEAAEQWLDGLAAAGQPGRRRAGAGPGCRGGDGGARGVARAARAAPRGQP
jgi:hypothetical protein